MSIRLTKDQRIAIDSMKPGCILCGGVGSGKSLTSLGYYYIYNGGRIEDGEMKYPMKDPQDLIIITTAAKRDKHEWDQELLAISLSPHIQTLYHNRVIIDSWNNIAKYANVHRAFFIFDEQRLVGKGKWVKAFLKIARQNTWILLSATPGDTWSDYIPVFLANGFFKNRTEFYNNHVIWNPHTNFPSIQGYLGTKKLERLRASILVDIGYISPAIRHDEYIMADYDRTLYKQVYKTRASPYEYLEFGGHSYPKPLENASEFCSMLRKIVNSDPSRGDIVLKILKDTPKCIIFYSFDFELEILRDLAYEEGTLIAEWNGHHHESVPDSERWVYLVQYNAGSEGWNCITTNSMIFYSESYSYRQMEQAHGRIDRRNTPFKDLYYWHIRSTSSIDLAINRALTMKKDFNMRRFSGSAQNSQRV